MREPKIEILPALKMVGIKIQTKLSKNETVALWRSFKPRVNEIKYRMVDDFYSIQIFPENLSKDNFTNETEFEKWAAVPVNNKVKVPRGMDSIILSGVYVVFIHKGLPAEFSKTTQHIFESWLPASKYLLDNRPHFEVMKPDYNPTDPNAEEEVWIPIRKK